MGYLQDFKVRFDHGKKLSWPISPFFKWSFDVTKNVLALAAIKALADKGNSYDLNVIYRGLFFLFTAYISIPVVNFLVALIPQSSSIVVRVLVAFAIIMPVISILASGLGAIETEILAEIIRLQRK